MTLAHWNKLIIKKSQIKMAFLFSFPLFCGVHQTNSNEMSKHRPNELKNILQTQNNVKSRLKSNNEKKSLKLRIKITTTLNLPH